MDDQDGDNDLYGDLSSHTLELEGAAIDEEEQRILAAAAGVVSGTASAATSSSSKRLSFHSSSTPSPSTSCVKCIDTNHQLVAAQCEIARLKTELAQVQSKLNITVRQNGVLLRNLSLLFSTAQVQLKRANPASITASSELKTVEAATSDQQPIKKQRVE